VTSPEQPAGLADFSGMMKQTPIPPQPEVFDDGCEVIVEAGNVVVRGPGAATFTLTPDAAVRSAERLLDAAEQARRAASGEHAPPFPPAELVSPHGA
jgi:hypothetical protein